MLLFKFGYDASMKRNEPTAGVGTAGHTHSNINPCEISQKPLDNIEAFIAIAQNVSETGSNLNPARLDEVQKQHPKGVLFLTGVNVVVSNPFEADGLFFLFLTFN